VCKHLADFSGRLLSLKSDQWPISVMEIGSLNQPLEVVWRLSALIFNAALFKK
jgi:hypothetical protein